ncbi:hypothetical protein NKH18_50570 [Streptomyces sp. M10(2022)]
MTQELTTEEWLAELAELKEVTEAVRVQSSSISESMTSIESRMEDIATHWSSPAYGTFDEISTWFRTVQRDLDALLKDIVKRMETSYRNYHDAELTNLDNLGDGSHGA